ncbi:hypothetical protein EQG67_03540 [Kosakonia cowanii]|nr:hypothetical protein EQG67_03540 [Kosakonia cowanii]
MLRKALVQLSQCLTGPGVLRSAEMGITSAGLQIRDANDGKCVHVRTTRQNIRKTTVHYFVSPPRKP